MTLFFMHIPKTGGGALDAVLRPLFENPAPRMSWQEAQQFDFSGYDYIAGHYPYCLMERLPDDTRVVTLLRDPVARVLSHYAYVHEHGYWRNPAYSTFCKQATLEQWLASDVTTAHSNLMARFMDDRLALPDDAEGVLSQVDYVGFQDVPNSLQEVAYRMAHDMGFYPPLVKGIYNASMGYPLSELRPATLRHIQAMNGYDKELYDAARIQETAIA